MQAGCRRRVVQVVLAQRPPESGDKMFVDYSGNKPHIVDPTRASASRSSCSSPCSEHRATRTRKRGTRSSRIGSPATRAPSLSLAECQLPSSLTSSSLPQRSLASTTRACRRRLTSGRTSGSLRRMWSNSFDSTSLRLAIAPAASRALHAIECSGTVIGCCRNQRSNVAGTLIGSDRNTQCVHRTRAPALAVMNESTPLTLLDDLEAIASPEPVLMATGKPGRAAVVLQFCQRSRRLSPARPSRCWRTRREEVGRAPCPG